MAKKDLNLDDGFQEVPLDEGFENVPLTPTTSQILSQKVQDLGSSVKTGLRDLGKGTFETGTDLARGVGQGLSLGFSDEALAALKAGSDIALGDKTRDDYKELYRKYHELEQQKLKESEERSPYLSTIGEIGGAIAPALLTAGATAPAIAKVGLKQILKEQGKKAALKELAKRAGTAALIAAPEGAIYGAGKSEGKILGATPEEKEQLIKDTAEGALTGGVAGATLMGIGQAVKGFGGAAKEKIQSKMTDFIEDTPFLRQVRKAKELGEEGVNIYSDKAKFGSPDILTPGQEGPKLKSGLLHADTEASRDLVDRIYKVDDQLGKSVGESINKATDSGQIIDMSDELIGMAQQFADVAQKDATISANPKAKKLYDTLFQLKNKTEMTPKELQSLRSDVVDLADSIKVKDPYIANMGYDFQYRIGSILKEAVPEYKIAANRFEEFRRLVPETIISGSTPVDISGVKLSNIKNQEGKLFDSTRKMIQGSQNPGFGSSKDAETFSNFIKGLKQFETSEAQRVKQGLIKKESTPKMIDSTDSQSKSIEKMVRDKADQSAMIQHAWRVNPQESLQTAAKGSLFGKGSVINVANKYGLYKDTITRTPVEITKKLLNAPEHEIRSIASKISDVPGLENLGNALLKGLDNKDQAAVNAAIFSIMQNPLARLKINGEQQSGENE